VTVHAPPPSATTSDGAPVTVRDLTRNFGDFVAVDRVSFEVGDGEIFGFLGPNGAGKTTTIKMLTGLLRPSGGQASVAGFDIWTERERVKTHIGYMSQRFSLYGDLSVAENIELYAGLYGVAGEAYRRRFAWVLDMAGLVGRSDMMTAELPLGWKQRLALGCAVLHEPPILFVDEPTSGVDPLTRRRFWDLIDELSRGGTTVFVSTHYMEEAEYCHRLALMNRGRLVALDTPSGLRGQMKEPLLRVSNVHSPDAVKRLEKAPGVLDAAMFGRDLHVVVDDVAQGREVIRRVLSPGGQGQIGIEPIRPSLEDVFVSLIRREGGAPL
jgi:ABC-2 type transport system ATP-binding protein